MLIKKRTLILSMAVPLVAGCATSVNKGGVQATAGAPVSTQVEPVRIPFDPSLPKFVVTVEPLQVGADGSAGGPPPGAGQFPAGNYYGWTPFGLFGRGAMSPAPAAYSAPLQGMSDKVGKGIAAQLVSALSNVGNIEVIDWEFYQANAGKPGSLVHPGEIGPFVIKGAVTEFNEVAEANNERKGGSLGWAGTALGIAGALTGTLGAGIAGAAVSAANPTWENTKARRTGSVGLDLQIVDPSSGRMAGTIVSHGNFTAESASSGFSLFGIGGGESAFASSALGQATRAALNDTASQLISQLRAKGMAYAQAIPKTDAPQVEGKRRRSRR